MIYSFPDTNFDLDQIANSGQCFRWKLVDPIKSIYEIPICGNRYKVWHEDDKIWVDDSNKLSLELRLGTDVFLYHYFDINTNYSHIIDVIPENDTYLKSAANKFSGIRILRQNPWEVFISFIISQNNNIPRIKNTIERLCQGNGGLFPAQWELMMMDLSKYGLGYRKQYIEDYLNSDKCYIPPEGSDYRDAFEYLQQFKGIGPKVANCICLYGLHYLEACPIDVWMKKIIDNRYDSKNPAWMNSKYAGVYQQYCFCYERYLSGRG